MAACSEQWQTVLSWLSQSHTAKVNFKLVMRVSLRACVCEDGNGARIAREKGAC